MNLADLPDEAFVQVHAVDPPLEAAAATRVIGAIDKLLQQLMREDRLAACAVEVVAGGALIVIAWYGATELSGCSKDKLAQVLADRERRDAVAILAAPPLVVETVHGARAINRATLKRMVAEGAIDGETAVYDRRVQRLGEWRTRGRVRVRDSWLRELLTL